MISVTAIIIEHDDVIANPYDKTVELNDNDGGKQNTDELKQVATASKQAQNKNQEINRTMLEH